MLPDLFTIDMRRIQFALFAVQIIFNIEIVLQFNNPYNILVCPFVSIKRGARMKYIILCIFAFFSFACQNQDVVNTPPASYEMSQNFPNPFTDTTTVYYSVPYVGGKAPGPHVRLVVNDRFNFTVATLVDTHNHSAGSNFPVVWNGRGANYQKVPEGIYYFELQQIDSHSDGDVYVHVRRVALKQ
jgi:hypothetical protein